MAFMLTYDENMRSSFMQTLCPSAKLSVKCKVKGWRLVLRRFFAGAEFSIEPGAEEDSVPAVLWEIDSADEKDLADFYPKELYEKILFSFHTGESRIAAFAFVLRNHETELPEDEYIEKIAAAYAEHDFDFWFVEQAMDSAADMIK